MSLKRYHKARFCLILILLGSAKFIFAQPQFPWPVTPFNQSHQITGNFAEFRDTGSADHFHNGTDIPKPDGSPVYPVKDGIVTNIGPVSTQGSNAFVRVQDVAYVHIGPNPSLAVGDSVFASETVLGTILSGLGHVHFTNGFVGAEKNSMLMNSGLTPLNDPWSPIIRFVRFYQNNTIERFPTNQLSGLVDIVVKVDEQNGPPTSRLSRRNNGTYKIGYKILSSDTSEVIFEPSNGGLRFQFDTKPSNSNIHRVFFDPLSSTSSHVYIVTNDITRDNFWNTAAIPEDTYVVMVFTEDTRNNADTMYVSVETTDADLIPPSQPVLRFVKEIQNGFTVSWFPNTDEDLLGYRLFFSFDNKTWSLFRDERSLNATQQDTSINQVLNRDVYFRLTAVDDAPQPNESIASDVYGLSNGSFTEKVLIVDGFDRTSGGSWNEPNHFFVFIHGSAIVANGFSFDTAPNESIVNGIIDLNDYEAIFWFLGDESTDDETFSTAEQNLVKDYLEGGGRLFVSGSEIAWDLDQDNASSASTPADEQFLHEYLKADYVADDSQILSVTGVEGTIFEGLSFDYGVNPYPEDFPDVINPFGGGVTVNLTYNASQNAAIQYQGLFGNSSIPGKLVYLAFPFETITGEENRIEVMGRVLGFFFETTSVESPDDTNVLPSRFALLQNYPNPFNPQTTIEYQLPATGHVTLTIYNALGQKVRTLVDDVAPAGNYKKVWDGLDDNLNPVASGVYLVKMKVDAVHSSRKEEFQKTQP
ncbi:T9SS type A sorting domain-containing protein, partial [candidate division KSB1 bacterium]|nr:T9SS type A sorting domain-containing protein [candidate division KSB1 bacterium]NIR70117.1 T9SS type A sorting domain-containing protein [candidate division KSB1 bacterium]NIS27542.1 T9SS type A sorting domain-containing protein [candidate division KSB1 bacterium]NIT74393.1 T9SS type A sorting domain-containing protein [candidate division KSB1 bacterium]NIU28260.1 T9SS type A sorting domain-containing protein [candidate division KSB1 bacterium]